MKTIYLTLFLFIIQFAYTQSSVRNEQYDSILAKKLGADEYGMKTYYFVYLKAGLKRDQTKEEAEKIQRAHMDNIGRLANEGKLIIAGPFLDKGDVRGIYIFNVSSLEEAEQLTNTDPAVISGRLMMEIHPWYGSASLMMIPELHKKVAKTEI